jgi:integrase
MVLVETTAGSNSPIASWATEIGWQILMHLPDSLKPKCPQCGCQKLYRDGLRYLEDGSTVQRLLCRSCGYRFSDPQQLKELHSNPRNLVKAKPIKTEYDSLVTSQICVDGKETKNLDRQTELKTVGAVEKASELDIRGWLLQFEFYCKKQGLSDNTTKKFSSIIRRLAKTSSLNDPETVKETLAYSKLANNTKVLYCDAYEKYLECMNLTWKRPQYKQQETMPDFLPTETEIDQLIAGSGKKTATLLLLMKETGMRLGECLSLKWLNVDFERRAIMLSKAEKGSLPRSFSERSTMLMNMLGNLPKKNEKVFGGMKTNTAIQSLVNARKKVAAKLGNPRIAKIHYHLIRHWFGTMEYHKRPDPDYVRRLLGHKRLSSTEIYINMEKLVFCEGSRDYVVKVCAMIEEFRSLLAAGFEYVTDFEGQKVLRKRK